MVESGMSEEETILVADAIVEADFSSESLAAEDVPIGLEEHGEVADGVCAGVKVLSATGRDTACWLIQSSASAAFRNFLYFAPLKFKIWAWQSCLRCAISKCRDIESAWDSVYEAPAPHHSRYIPGLRPLATA